MSAEPMANTDSDKNKDDARRQYACTAYQVAANLYMQENAVTWSRFSIMVVASSIIVAATGDAASPDNQLYLLAMFLPIAGLILCGIWWYMTKRGFDYHDSWRKDAQKLEEKFFSEITQTGPASRSASSWPRPLENAEKIRSPGGPTARDYANWLIYLFVALYALALVQVVII
jgi:hypothetical protein